MPDYVSPLSFATLVVDALPCICGTSDTFERSLEIFLRISVISLLHLKIVWAI